jgi:hypothetical protein
VQNAEYLLPRIPQVLEVAPHRLSHTASMLRILSSSRWTDRRWLQLTANNRFRLSPLRDRAIVFGVDTPILDEVGLFELGDPPPAGRPL